MLIGRHRAFSRLTVILLVVCPAFFAACGNAAEQEDEAVKSDAQASSVLAEINKAIRVSRAISPDNLRTLQELRDRYPNSAIVRQAYQDALIVREDWPSLESFLLSTPAADRTREDAVLLAKVYTKTGKYADAAEVLEPLAAGNTNDLEINGLLGLSYFHLDRTAEAGAAFDKVWDRIVAEKRIDEMTMRGLVYLREKNLPKALEILTASYAIKQDHIATNNALSRVYARLGDTDKAEAFRALTVKGQDKAVAEQYRASQTVTRIVELERAWKEKDYSRVLQHARQMVPSSQPNQRAVLYQYIYEASKALGDEPGAQQARAEIQKLQQQKQ
jgi:predicted Zn-dependent protease